MKLFTILFLSLLYSTFAINKDTVIINTVKTEIDTIIVVDTIRIIDTGVVNKKIVFDILAVTNSSITIKMVEKKKGFFGRLLEKFDQKLEKKSKEKECGCCSDSKDKKC